MIIRQLLNFCKLYTVQPYCGKTGICVEPNIDSKYASYGCVLCDDKPTTPTAMTRLLERKMWPIGSVDVFASVTSGGGD